MRRYLLWIGWVVVLHGACQQKAERIEEAVLYPNDDARLAWLMREMFEDMKEIRLSIEKKEEIGAYFEKHREILTAEATDPKLKDAKYEMMARGYLESLRLMEDSPAQLLEDSYQVLVASCLGCHQQLCPGPVKKIKLLTSN